MFQHGFLKLFQRKGDGHNYQKNCVWRVPSVCVGLEGLLPPWCNSIYSDNVNFREEYVLFRIMHHLIESLVASNKTLRNYVRYQAMAAFVINLSIWYNKRWPNMYNDIGLFHFPNWLHSTVIFHSNSQHWIFLGHLWEYSRIESKIQNASFNIYSALKFNK